MSASPKVTVAVIVYNRLYNLQHWLECWAKCDQTNAELVVIHNTNNLYEEEYINLCAQHGVVYVPRPNVGYDIGALQDICRDRLPGFPLFWKRLLWVTDDTFPMAQDFVQQFAKRMTDKVGVVCMEISPYVDTHIRTTGFMLDRELAFHLNFPADPVETKQHCYLFEHRGNDHFYRQVLYLGLDVVMVAPREVSPLWDSGYHRRIDRRAEHETKFGQFQDHDRVVFICPIYKSYPLIIASLLEQTHKNWRLILIHDGPDTEKVFDWVVPDPRITFMETPKHGGRWGHYIRQVGIRNFQHMGDFIVITNPDNYHVPVYCEYMLRGFKQQETAVATYCSDMVHSYKAWKVIPCKLEQGYLDCAGVMVRSAIAAEVGWRDISSHSADWVYFSDIMASYGAKRFKKVEGCLLIHN